MEEHDANDCPLCRPVIVRVGMPIEEWKRFQRAADQAWRDALPDIRRAWHRVTCLNSRDPVDVRQAKTVVDRMKELIGDG